MTAAGKEQQQEEENKTNKEEEEQEQQQDTNEKSSSVALEWKERGNVYYQKQEFAKAAQAYQWGIDSSTSSKGTQETMVATAIALRSNLAMVLLKLDQFQRANQVCTEALELDPSNTKVLYRRAMAREGLTMLPKEEEEEKRPEGSSELLLTPCEQKKMLAQAMEDLQRALNVLEDNSTTFSMAEQRERSRTQKACQTALDRMKRAYSRFMDVDDDNDTDNDNNPCQKILPQQQSPKLSTTATANTTTTPTTTPQPQPPTSRSSPLVAASVSQQKKDVQRLLMARTSALPNHKTKSGEAFFILDWKWWCHWCRHVDFFSQQDPTSSSSSSSLLKLLPPGAILPPTTTNKHNNDMDDDDDSSTDDDDDDDNDDDDTKKKGPPGPIDNSRLLQGNSVFEKQWYHHHDGSSATLKPNLVRGYHFEIVPREVYNALRSWYGEVTPSICRRTTTTGPNHKVVLYNTTTNDHPQNGVVDPSHPSAVQLAHKCHACLSPGASARCKRCMSVQYCDRGCQEANWPYHKTMCKALASNNNNNNKVVVPESEGCIGLNSLGNTCFMNSALQCLSHATPLTRHFLSNKYQADVNTSNPLGTGGKLAMAYDTVMKEIWMKQKAGTAISPTALKRAIALFAPRFAGCLQHDSQEFLAYLLDGLHEDLNRIRKAPYVEMPEVTDGQNMSIASAEAWAAHQRRNDSLVMDTFYGQFQSTCVCPKCDRVSVSFDAFNHVSLEIPQTHKATVTIPILVFRRHNNNGETKDNHDIVPCRYGVELSRQSLVIDLRRTLAELMGIAPNRLIICDIYENTIYELLHDKKPIANIKQNDVLTAYEVDPYTNASIHMVVTHTLLMYDQEGQEQRPPFGFPFITSFDANATCQQVWQHLWSRIAHMVVQEGAEEGYVDAHNRYRYEDVLTIRVVNSQGQIQNVFPSSSSSSEEEGAAAANVLMTPDFPVQSKEKIVDLLGQNCTENFLFLALQWKNPPLDDQLIQNLIIPQNFMKYVDHKTLLDAIQKQQRMQNNNNNNSNYNNGVTLAQCFETFTKPERLDEQNMWYCSKCKDHVRALKTMKLCKLPNILVVHLKRFEFKHALRRDKLDTFVKFPLDGLDMKAHCTHWKNTRTTKTKTTTTEGEGSSSNDDDDDDPFVDVDVPSEYDLFGIVNHYGRMGFGHYTAFARRWDESGMHNEWALFDDSRVRPVAPGEPVVTPAAYVLFYRRRVFH